MKITLEMRRRNPLITPEAAELLKRLREHPDAPKWNYVCGDRLDREDVEAIDGFRGELAEKRRGSQPGAPSAEVRAAIEASIPRVMKFRKTVSPVLNLERDWDHVPTTSREDLAATPGEMMPDDVDLARMVVHTTAGTTGHAILIPHHPRAGSMYKPLIEEALARHGVRIPFDSTSAGCMLLGAQAKTAMYATVHAAWNNSGFAKLNLNPAAWPGEGSAGRYLEEFSPPLLTGDPISFAEMMRLGIDSHPRAMISTAVALNPLLKRRLEKAYNCPVIDWYSLNETGPIAYACPRGHLHVLSHDLHVEAVDARGRSLPDGKRGEITVSGGRNPFLPMLRYRTGDWGRISHAPCACGDPMPRILDLEGRPPVEFRGSDGTVVTPVDISRVLRAFPIVQHRFTQRRNRACELLVRPFRDGAPLDIDAVRQSLAGLFGPAVPISVKTRASLGRLTGKVVSYRNAK